MSPMSQFAAVATLTFAVLGYPVVAFALLATTLVLLLFGFVSDSSGAPTPPRSNDPEADPPPPYAPTPNEEASRVDG